MSTWREAAACRGEDPELFFPIGAGAEFAPQIREAKAVCAGCPVRTLCLDEGLAVPYGIWGGLDEEERRSLRRRRQRQASAERAKAVAS